MYCWRLPLRKLTSRIHPLQLLSLRTFWMCLIVLCHFLLSFHLKRLHRGRDARREMTNRCSPREQKLARLNVNYCHCKWWQRRGDTQIIFFYCSHFCYWTAIMESDVLFHSYLEAQQRVRRQICSSVQWQWVVVYSIQSTSESAYMLCFSFLFSQSFEWNNWTVLHFHSV